MSTNAAAPSDRGMRRSTERLSNLPIHHLEYRMHLERPATTGSYTPPGTDGHGGTSTSRGGSR